MSWFKKEKKDSGDVYSYLKSLNIYMEELNNNINKMHSTVTNLDDRTRGLRDSMTKINNSHVDQRDWAANLAAKLFVILDEIRAAKTPDVIEKKPKKEKNPHNLNKYELIIYNAVVNSPCPISLKELESPTGFSSAKINYHLTGLVWGKYLITRKYYGKKYKFEVNK